MELKPNHICKNINCKKEYYACDYCGKTQNWRSMACSIECYNAYMKQIEQSRNGNISIDTYPNRIDMSHKEVVEMVNNTPIEVVKEKTMNELSEYLEDIKTIGLGKTIDKINKEIDNKKLKKKHR